MKHMILILSMAMSTVGGPGGTQALAGEENQAGPDDNSGTASGELVLFKFTGEADLDGWRVQDDVVMGGRSKGRIAVNEAGHAVFSGDVSLENNGGFSSVQRYLDPKNVEAYHTASIRLKGDGKRYQFRVESNRSERHSYVYPFETSGDWQTVEIPLAEMYPVFHGNRLDLPNYPGRTLSQVRFLIANGTQESFRLEIESIILK